MTIRLLLTVAAAALFAAGCGTSHNVAWPDPRPLADDIPASKPAIHIEKPDEASSESAPDTLTLQAALRLALKQNPQLLAVGWEVRAREAATLQAGLWPNPEAEAELEEFAGTGPLTGFKSAEIGLSLGQIFPLGGDIRAARDEAAARRDLSGWEYESARLHVVTRTRQFFVDVIASQARLVTADSLLELAMDFERTVSDRVEAGKVSPLELSRAEIVRTNAELSRHRAAQHLQATREQLTTMWGSGISNLRFVVGRLEIPDVVPDWEVIERMVVRNPEVARWAAEMRLRASRLEKARAERIPDPLLRVGPTRFRGTGEMAVKAALSIPVPLFDRKQGAIQEARYRLREGEAGRMAARSEVHRAIAETYTEMTTARTTAERLRLEIVPAAREMFEKTREGYREGKFDLLTLIDAQRTLFEASNRYLDALRDYHWYRAELEGLIGTPLDIFIDTAE